MTTNLGANPEIKPEVLAPAGNYQSFLAAVAAGANGVYLAGQKFGARASAGNFTREEMLNAITYAHLNGVKIYVTANTLIADCEMSELFSYIQDLYNIGIDALIVQDIGLMTLVKEKLPDFPIYASTQMTISNSDGCLFAEEMGAKRVILAREVSLEAMKEISSKTTVPLEAFVHGALCISYSGQCLFSSLVGGRSGNRGRCAQPCRMQYQLLRNGEAVDDFSHLLSPKDLCNYDKLDELKEAGIKSFKIEGRMKRPEYVAVVVSAYAGNHSSDKSVDEALLQAFNRDFTHGYLYGDTGSDLMSYNRPNNRGVKLGRVEYVDNKAGKLLLSLSAPLTVGDGVEIWVKKGGRKGFIVNTIEIDGEEVDRAGAGEEVIINYIGDVNIGDRVFKTADIEQNSQAQAMMEVKTLPLNMKIYGRIGEPIKLKVWDEKGEVNVSSEDDYIGKEATKHPADYDLCYKQLSRLGGSYWHLENLECDLEGSLMMPASVLNELRRKAVELLEEERLAPFKRKKVSMGLAHPKGNKKSQVPEMAVFCDSYQNAYSALKAGADILYIGGERFRQNKDFTKEEVARLKEKGGRIYYVLPDIARENEIAYYEKLVENLKTWDIEGILVGGVWAVHLLKRLNYKGKIVGNLGLNAFNSWTCESFTKNWGLDRITLSSELNFLEIKNLEGNFKREAVIHGNMRMMVMEHCVLGSKVGGKTSEKDCSCPCAKKDNYTLKDTKGFSFPMQFDKSCRSYIYNGHQLCVVEDLPHLVEAGVDVVRLDLRFYSEHSVTETVKAYRDALNQLKYGKTPDFEKIKERIEDASVGKLTKGHYYRGVE